MSVLQPRRSLEIPILLLAGVAVFFSSSAYAQTKKVLLVAADGSAQFKTVQEAIDAAPDGQVRINIKPGEYRQVLAIKANGI
jgi:pectinesterase